jgi:hypothetical protein
MSDHPAGTGCVVPTARRLCTNPHSSLIWSQQISLSSRVAQNPLDGWGLLLSDLPLGFNLASSEEYSQQARHNKQTSRSTEQETEEGGTNSDFCARHHKPTGQHERQRYLALDSWPVAEPIVTRAQTRVIPVASLLSLVGASPVIDR